MTFTKARFTSFEEYLRAEVSDLPEGRCEYWDGELVPVMSESLENGTIAIFIQLALIAIGIPFELIRYNCEVEVIGRPQSRIPDLTIIGEIHLTLLKERDQWVVSSTFPSLTLTAEQMLRARQS